MNTAPTQPSATPSRSAIITIAAVVVALIVVGLLVGHPQARSPGGVRMFPRVQGPAPDARSLLRMFGVGSVTWYACAFAMPILWWLAYRMPLAQQRAWRSLGLQFAAAMSLTAIAVVIQYGVTYRGASLAPPLGAFSQTALLPNVVPIIAIAALVNAAEIRRRAVRGALETQRLRAELAESRLAAVTSQLQPHFLFNTLQSISTLIHRDPAAADATLAKLSDLLRDVLRRSRSALAPLGEELRMTETYLELARVRFGDRLRTTLDVDDGVGGAMVPVLLLQPLVENALQHGLGRRASGGCIGISAHRRDGRLNIAVWDDGVGLENGALVREGMGLANTRERLRHAFGDEQSLEVRPRAGGGVEAVIRVPFQVEKP